MRIPTVRLYLDKRKCKGDSLAQVKLSIGHKSKTAYIMTNVYIKSSQWDIKAEKVVKHPQRTILTDYLNAKRMEVNECLIKFANNGELVNKSVADIRKMIECEIEGENMQISFIEYYQRFCEKKNGRTREIYETTLKRIKEYDKDIKRRHFEDITYSWLCSFDEHLSIASPSRNARNIHLRNIRAVFNDAINGNITTFYPFKKFSIKGEQTIKRSLTVEQIKYIFSIKNSPIQYDIDIFKLMFLLIGINLADLYNLKDIRNGRIEYYRAKTHKLYSIKVEPEALSIINRYKGKENLLDLSERYASANNFKSSINRRLKRLFSGLSTYWARHTWATMAAELDIPIETISHALGHSYGSEITAIYVRFNDKKIDEANRKVIDFVLNKRN